MGMGSLVLGIPVGFRDLKLERAWEIIALIEGVAGHVDL